MKKECETFVKKFLPFVKQRIAIILIRKYGFTQIQAAKKLGVSQTAISLYLNKLNPRHDFKFQEKDLENLAKKLMLDKDISQDMCSLCNKITHARCSTPLFFI